MSLLGNTITLRLNGFIGWHDARTAGAEMQTILNNPLASPFTLGSLLRQHLVQLWRLY